LASFLIKDIRDFGSGMETDEINPLNGEEIAKQKEIETALP